MMLSWFFKKNKGREITSIQGNAEGAKTDILQTGRDKMKDNEWDVNHADAVTLAKEVVSMLENSQKPLVNKYLYLGPHGAAAWEAVETSGSFSIKRHARNLLKNNFDEILNMIQEDSNETGADVVSLGTGAGNDDVDILSLLWERDQTEIALFAVDLGGDLLHRAMKKISKSFNRQTERKYATSLGPICIDISEIYTLRPHFSKHKKHHKRLYHLLGLTLGNNNELTFLNQISDGMLPGDYLLVGVDFCLDNPSWKAQSEASYANTEWAIDAFVSGPLKTAIALAQNPKIDLHFDGIFVTPSGYQCDFLQEKFQIVKKPIAMADRQEPRLSCVPKSLSIARYYVPSKFVEGKFDATDSTKRKFGKLCDFSNKYKSAEFEKWLRSHEKELGLTLMHEKNKIKLWGNESQYLVLLKKTDQPFDPTAEQLYNNILKNVDSIFSTYLGMDNKRIVTEAQNVITKLKNANSAKMIGTLKIYPRRSTLLNFPKDISNEQKVKEYLKDVRLLLQEVEDFEV